VTGLGALCTDFYINQKLSLKMDLPSARETVLDMFDRVRKELPNMDRLRRYDGDRESLLDAQPFLGFALTHQCDVQGFVEVKTRSRSREVAKGHYSNEPISVYLTVRRYGPFQSIRDFADSFGTLAGHAERLSEDRVIPNVVMPIRETLMSRPG